MKAKMKAKEKAKEKEKEKAKAKAKNKTTNGNPKSNTKKKDYGKQHQDRMNTKDGESETEEELSTTINTESRSVSVSDHNSNSSGSDDDHHNKDKQHLDKIKRKRQSHLVRINTDTKWSNTQLDLLEQQLRDEISKIQGEYATTENRNEIEGITTTILDENGTQNVIAFPTAIKETNTTDSPAILQMNEQEQANEGQAIPDKKDEEVKVTEKVEIIEGTTNPNSTSDVVIIESIQKEIAYEVKEIDNTNNANNNNNNNLTATTSNTLKRLESKEHLLVKPKDENMCGCRCACSIL